jgi:DNA-binding NarL/FixJ family response regulator
MIRVLLVDGHVAFRQALTVVINAEPDMEVVGQVGCVGDARLLLSVEPAVDVAVVDLTPANGTAAEVVSEITCSSPTTGVLVLADGTDPVLVATAVEAGAAGASLVDGGLADLLAAIRHVDAGEPLMSAAELVELMRMAHAVRRDREQAETVRGLLTTRERDVLQGLADGRSNREIAEQLHISLATQRTHVANIFAKLGTHSQLAAVMLAVRAEVVEIR